MIEMQRGEREREGQSATEQANKSSNKEKKIERTNSVEMSRRRILLIFIGIFAATEASSYTKWQTKPTYVLHTTRCESYRPVYMGARDRKERKVRAEKEKKTSKQTKSGAELIGCFCRAIKQLEALQLCRRK